MYQKLSDVIATVTLYHSILPYLHLDIDIEHCQGIQLQHFTFVTIILPTIRHSASN